MPRGPRGERGQNAEAGSREAAGTALHTGRVHRLAKPRASVREMRPERRAGDTAAAAPFDGARQPQSWTTCP